MSEEASKRNELPDEHHITCECVREQEERGACRSLRTGTAWYELNSLVVVTRAFDATHFHKRASLKRSGRRDGAWSVDAHLIKNLPQLDVYM